MTIYRVTVRTPGKTELRGFTSVDSFEEMQEWSNAMAPIGQVVASVMDGQQDDLLAGQPTPEKSEELIKGIIAQNSPENALAALSHLHYMQAMVIRGERDSHEAAVMELRDRELHHFETEQENERLKGEASE
jgi:hypothetical protein